MKCTKHLAIAFLLAAGCFLLSACAMVDTSGVTVPTNPVAGVGAALNDTGESSDESDNYAYRNDFFEFCCTLPDDWYVFNQDEIDSFAAATSDLVSGNEAGQMVQDELDSGRCAYDFYAVSLDGTQLVTIVISALTLPQAFASEQQLMDASADASISLLEYMGASNPISSTKTVTFANQEHVALTIQSEISSYSFFEIIVMTRFGPFSATITAGSLAEDTTSEILAYFSPLE